MKIRIILILGGIAIALALISLWMGQQAYGWFPPQASLEALLIDRLFSVLVTLGTFIFLGVVGTLTYSMLFQQAGKYDTSDGPPMEGNVTLEVVWTAIPLVLVIWIAGYSYQIYDQMSILGPMEHVHLQTQSRGMATAVAAPLEDAAGAAIAPMHPIEVHARQWVWEFRYPDQNVTSTELHLPNNQRVKLVLQSEDVLHGFFVPAFRIKQDIIPGRVIDFEFTPIREGRYRLRDSQYSGTYFAAMQTDVVVESSEAYQQWLADAAAHPPVLAYNRAFDEFHRAKKNLSAGWKTVEPAPPPLVNAPSHISANLPSGQRRQL
ncbi:cytochrome C oxidase subunit II [Neosynechococcus sphagnicola sy1]|uniref:Cytochrome c oxidase subunit 2 n=1 Tax=Neosynechococcus sphagnicola sy1 TaxID=1497020 RepID=A0A098TLA5_9CYAN|nr:cytochrome c oxidase subunit II [Neosynechococcus sphagnicola]KGF73085.1 cytochrome C oxidase subunit II [Neosynechococcus sphagnicola sy1]